GVEAHLVRVVGYVEHLTGARVVAAGVGLARATDLPRARGLPVAMGKLVIARLEGGRERFRRRMVFRRRGAEAKADGRRARERRGVGPLWDGSQRAAAAQCVE